MKDKYEFYKIDFKYFIILFKNGNFYISINEDAIVMNNIFNHKIVNVGSFIKTGFPLPTLNKIENILHNKQINYLIIDDKIINKIKFKNNKYSNYLTTKDYNLTFNKIDRINNLLISNISKLESNNILDKLEKIICKINY